MVPTQRDIVALPNPNANGNAWFVQEVKTVANADSEMVALYTTNTKHIALLQQKNKPASVREKYAGGGEVKLLSYQPNNLVYQTQNAEDGFAVFSEIYYPKGWDAYLDGKKAEYVCTDYLLRGMEVPKGNHKIEFKFEPGIYKTGDTLSLIGSLLVIGLFLFCVYVSIKKKEMPIGV
jgi:uncharacterized membrane protein YfhO